jgi:tetratricopeptide (TPR) repeat protein
MLVQLEALRSDRKTFVHADSLIGDFCASIGEFDLAIQSYRNGEKHEPKLSAIYQKGIADVLITQGRGEEALAIVSKLHRDDPRDIETAAIRASLLAKGDRQQVRNAVGEIDALVAKQPGNHKLHLYLGRAYQAEGNPASLEKAVQQFEISLKQNPESLSVKLALAEVDLTNGQSGLAIQMADKILQSSPQNLSARLTRARALVKLGESQKARQELASILRNHKAPEARFQLALLDLAEKHFREAEKGFQSLTEAGDVRGVFGLVECKEHEGQLTAAALLLQDEIRKNPNSDAFRLALSNVELRLGQIQDARAILEQLARKNPSAPGLLTRLGAIRAQLGEKSGAIQSYREALQLQPSDLQAALSLAGLLWEAGQQNQALALYEDALKVDPENPTALNNLAYIQAEYGVDLDRALGYAQRALERSPEDPNFADTLGLIYIRKKLTDQALQVLRDLVSRVPNNPSFHLHFAMALYNARKYELAKKELEKALHYNPSASEQYKIKELMARIR